MGLDLHADQVILAELGRRLARCRLNAGVTQSALAFEAGISKRTLERVEAGESVQLTNFLRLLRALDLLANLEALVPPDEPGPMDLLRMKGKRRQRASSARATKDAGGTRQLPTAAPRPIGSARSTK